MKTILGHRSWNEQEVLDFFDHGSFTMCTLPHYRYHRVQAICANLKRCGLIEATGHTPQGVNYVAKPEYHQWRRDVAAGKAPASLTKLFKLLNPPKQFKRICPYCREEYETVNLDQKACSKTCRMNHERRIA